MFKYGKESIQWFVKYSRSYSEQIKEYFYKGTRTFIIKLHVVYEIKLAHSDLYHGIKRSCDEIFWNSLSNYHELFMILEIQYPYEPIQIAIHPPIHPHTHSPTHPFTHLPT